MNILVITLGTSWAIVPELVGFVNPDQLPLYGNHPEALRAAFLDVSVRRCLLLEVEREIGTILSA